MEQQVREEDQAGPEKRGASLTDPLPSLSSSGPQPEKRARLDYTVPGDYRRRLEQRWDSVSKVETGSSLSTELYITEGLRSEVSVQHEETQMESLSKRTLPEASISCSHIFKQQGALQQHSSIRNVLTVGVAGAGKTFSVLKFCVDWAQGSENQDVQLVVPLFFRELHLLSRGRYSLMELIQELHPELQSLSAHALSHSELLFICDGLDESRLPLDFSCELISDVTHSSKLSTLLVNLIRGDLLPHALIWLTCRPAAANQIPARCVDRITEVRGFFTEEQKEMFFRSSFSDEEQLQTVLSHLRTSRSLHTMCQIPVLCCITATVLEHVLRSNQSEVLPQTLTDLFAHFLLVQVQRKKKKEEESSSSELSSADCELLLKLARLAFEQLLKGNLTFYQEDLKRLGLDLNQASSGLCSEIFRRQTAFKESLYFFIHLSLQEFLAAVHVLHCFNTKNLKELKRFVKDLGPDTTLEVFLKKVLLVTLKSPSGHLDLFVRFLYGLTLESNQKLLGALLGPSQSDSNTRQTLINNLKDMKTKASPDRCINIFHCLTELHDLSVHQQIQNVLKKEKKNDSNPMRLSSTHCSALAHALQMSEQVLEELKLKSFYSLTEGRLKLVPAVRNCRAALFCDSKISKIHLEILASTLSSSSNHLRTLDLSNNPEVGSQIQALCEGLQSPWCRLEALSLKKCGLSESSCSSLASALKSNSSLKDLVLQENTELRDSAVEHLCVYLRSPECHLEKLNLSYCDVAEVGCSSLASALNSHLKELNLNGNTALPDPGLERLCGFLQRPDCRLEVLKLYRCKVTQAGCLSLASALKANPSHLRELDIGGNRGVKDQGVEHLCGFLQSPDCRLEVLRVVLCGLSGLACSSLAAALKSNPSHLRILDLWANDLTALDVMELKELKQSPDCRLEDLDADA